MAVEVLAEEVAAVVADEHAIGIQHRHDLCARGMPAAAPHPRRRNVDTACRAALHRTARTHSIAVGMG